MTSIDNNTIVSRSQFFLDEYTKTKDQIVQKVLLGLLESNYLKLDAFVQKYITEKGQQELSDLDQRTKILFNQIMYGVCRSIAEMRLLYPTVAYSELINDVRLYGNFIKEASLPLVKNLVTNLDGKDNKILDDVISGKASSALDDMLKQFKMGLS